VVVDPVPRERAGPDHLEVGAAVGVDGQCQGRPHCWRGQLHERCAAYQMGRGHAGAAAGGLLKAHPAVPYLRLRAQVQEGRPREGQGGGRQPQGGAADAAPSQVAVGGDAAIFHFDEGAQLVDEAGPVPGQQPRRVLQLVGGWRVVVGDPAGEGEVGQGLDGPQGKPRNGRDRGLDAHGSILCSARSPRSGRPCRDATCS
jgi:hypothetical protein